MIERIVVAAVCMLVLSAVLFVSTKVDLAFLERYNKISWYIFLSWLLLGGLINWVIVGNVNFIFTYLYPQAATPLIVSSVMYGFKSWLELRKLKANSANV
jgi:hypothetical protein